MAASALKSPDCEMTRETNGDISQERHSVASRKSALNQTSAEGEVGLGCWGGLSVGG